VTINLNEPTQSEEVLLGLVVTTGDASPLEELGPDDFTTLNAKELCAVLKYMDINRIAIDPITVTDHMTAQQELEEAEVQVYLAGVLASIPYVADHSGYAATIKERSGRRGLVRLLEKALAWAHDIGTPFPEVLGKVEGELHKLSTGGVVEAEVDLVELHTDSVIRVEEYQDNPGVLRGTTYGYENMDNMLGGASHQLHWLLGYTKAGKSTLLRGMILRQLLAGVQVFYFCMEDPSGVVWDALVCDRSGIPSKAMMLGQFKSMEAEWQKQGEPPRDLMDIYAQTSAELSALPLHLHCGYYTIPQIKSIVARNRTGDDCFVYVDTINVAGGEGKNRYERMTNKCEMMQAMGPALGVTPFGTVQVNRGANARRLTLSDGRDSGAIEETGRVILDHWWEGMFNPQCENPALVEVGVLAQNWGGPGGGVRNVGFQFRAHIPRLEPLTVSRGVLTQPLLDE
jgi:replicative DNA helicase